MKMPSLEDLDILEECSFEQLRVLQHLQKLTALPADIVTQLETADISLVMKLTDCEVNAILELQSMRLLLFVNMKDRIVLIPTDTGNRIAFFAELLGYFESLH